MQRWKLFKLQYLILSQLFFVVTARFFKIETKGKLIKILKNWNSNMFFSLLWSSPIKKILKSKSKKIRKSVKFLHMHILVRIAFSRTKDLEVFTKCGLNTYCKQIKFFEKIGDNAQVIDGWRCTSFHFFRNLWRRPRVNLSNNCHHSNLYKNMISYLTQKW